jgi:hypothetical protein
MIAALLLAASAPGLAPGIYSDVRMSSVTGDLGGIEVRVEKADDGQLTVAAVWCEGWCNHVVTAPLTRNGDTYSFDYQEPVFADGALVAGPVYRMTLRPVGKRVLLTATGEGMEAPVQHRLKRIAKPFGLAVAAMEQAAD